MNFFYELNYTTRVLRRKLGFSMLCVIVIALGYSITMPLYSVVKNLAYASLPFDDSDRLVMVRQTNTRFNYDYDITSFDSYQLDVLENSVEGFESLSVYQPLVATLSDGEVAEQLSGVRIASSALQFSDPLPILGRAFVPSDEMPESEPVVLIGYDVWQNYYGADSELIGKTARVSGVNHTIIGVMPEGYRFPMRAEIWLPFDSAGAAQPGEESSLAIVGLLESGVGRSQAEVEIESIMQRLAEEYPDIYGERSAKIIPFTQSAISNALPLFNSIGGLAFCIYLLICLNVGNLLIIRANERIGELAIRKAVGANRLMVISHILLESFLICSAGAILGMVASGFLLEFLHYFFINLIPSSQAIPFWFDFTFNIEALQFAMLMITVLWLLSGSFAAWRTSRSDLATVIGSESKGTASAASGRVTRGLVVVQLVISFFLLVVSISYLLDFRSNVDASVVEQPEDYLSARVSLNLDSYLSAEQRELYRLTLKQELESLSEFETVSFGSTMPGGVSAGVEASSGRGNLNSEQDPLRFGQNWVSPDYFRSLGFDLLAGRQFERVENSEVAIVDEAAVSRLGLEEPVLGSQITIQGDQAANPVVATIVGVMPYIGSVDPSSGAARFPTISMPMSQGSPLEFRLIIKLRNPEDSSVIDLEQIIRRVATRVDRDVALYEFELLSTPIERNNSFSQLISSMFGAAALGAVILAVIGVYGLISRAVLARRAELGIRRAVGSSDADILKLFLRHGTIYLIVAMLIGGMSSVFALNLVRSATSTMSSLNIFASLSTILVGVSIFIGALVLVASYVPARRAISMEPGEALHYE